jgi:hypothetical protein
MATLPRDLLKTEEGRDRSYDDGLENLQGCDVGFTTLALKVICFDSGKLCEVVVVKKYLVKVFEWREKDFQTKVEAFN